MRAPISGMTTNRFPAPGAIAKTNKDSFTPKKFTSLARAKGAGGPRSSHVLYIPLKTTAARATVAVCDKSDADDIKNDDHWPLPLCTNPGMSTKVATTTLPIQRLVAKKWTASISRAPVALSADQVFPSR